MADIRKEKAQSRVTWLLWVVLLLYVTGAYCFTSDRAVSRYCRQYVLQEVVDVAEYRESLFQRFTMCYNHERLVVIETKFHLLGGWQAGTAMEIERDENASVDCGFINMKTGGDNRVMYVCGAVNDGKIARLSVLGRFTGDVEDFDIEAELSWEGMQPYPDATYFIKKVTDFYDPPLELIQANRSITYPTQFHIVTYDENDKIIGILPIENEVWANG